MLASTILEAWAFPSGTAYGGELVGLSTVKLPWQKSESESASTASGQATSAEANEATSIDAATLPAGYTPPKGKPTPKRKDQEIARGVRRDPNAMSAEQMREHRKELKKSMGKEEWKQYKKAERAQKKAQNEEVREKMDSGDERYLLDRDKGEVRRWIRDWVDSKRFLANYFMPFAFLLLIVLFTVGFFPEATVQWIMTAMWIIIAIFFIEAFFIGWRANKAAGIKFPGTDETGFRLGFYAYSRANQIRSWRTPRPQVEVGDTV